MQVSLPAILDELRSSWETGRQAHMAEKETADILRNLLSQILTPAQMVLFDHGVTSKRQNGATWETAQMEALTVLMEGHNQPQPAPDKPPMPRREGLAALQYVTSNGIKVTPCKKGTDGNYYFSTPYKDEYAKLKGQNPKAKISDCPGFISDIEEYTSDGIELFRFIPADHGLLCLDLDVKNGKNGITDLDRLLTSWGKPKEKRPVALRDIPGSFPCYTQTPGGGIHLYFKYSGPPPESGLFSREYPSIEIKAGALNITAPGSYKDGKPYILYGNLDQAPNLYPFMAEKLPRAKQEPKKYISMNKKEYGRPSWELIEKWTVEDGEGSAGRDAYAYSLAHHAASHDWPKYETETAMENMSWNYDKSFTQSTLKKCINSAYKNVRGAA